MYTWLKLHWLRLTAVLFLIGIVAQPTDVVYYQLTNWFVTGAAVTIAWQAHRQRQEFYMWLYALLAVCFNPLAPLYLPQDTWRLADMAAGLFLVTSMFVVRAKKM